MTSSPTENPSAEENMALYDDGLTELQEKKKLGLIAQDEYDRLHEELVQRIFGTRPEHT